MMAMAGVALAIYITITVVGTLTYHKPVIGQSPCGNTGVKYARIIGHTPANYSLVIICNNGNYITHTEAPGA